MKEVTLFVRAGEFCTEIRDRNGSLVAAMAIREDERALARLFVASPKLLAACILVRGYLKDLEANTAPDDPLAIVRRIYHAPLLAALDPAIAEAQELP